MIYYSTLAREGAWTPVAQVEPPLDSHDEKLIFVMREFMTIKMPEAKMYR